MFRTATSEDVTEKKTFCTTELVFSFGKKIRVKAPSLLLSNRMSFFRLLHSVYYNSIITIRKKRRHTTLLTSKTYWLRDAPTGLTINNCTLCPHCIYVFRIYLRTNRDFCPIQRTWLVFIIEKKSAYCAVRTGSLNKEVCASSLTLILLTWRIWWDPNNASRWQMGFNLAFKGLKGKITIWQHTSSYIFRSSLAHYKGAHNCTQEVLICSACSWCKTLTM